MNRVAFVALAVFVFSIPAENGVSIPGFGSLTRLIGFGAIGLSIVALFDRGRLRFRVPTLFLVIATAFVAWTALTFFWSLDPVSSLARALQYAQLFVFAWMLHQLARTERRYDLLMQVFVLGCYAMIAVGTITAFGPGGAGFRDVAFPANDFAAVAGLAIPMAWGLVIRRSFPSMQLINGVYPVFALLAVMLAASRGGLLVAAVGIAVIPLTLPRLGLLRRVALVAIIVGGTAVTFLWLPSAVPELERNLERLGRLEEDLFEGTMTGRTRIWEAGLQVFETAPILGIGAGSYGIAVEPILGSARAAHNAFLSVAVTSGLVGVGLFLAMFVIVLAGLVASPGLRADHLVLFAALIVAIMPLNAENDKFLWFILALLASVRPVLLRS